METTVLKFQKTKVIIKDVDMGGETVYNGIHFFKVGMTKDEIKANVLRTKFIDYGNTYKFNITQYQEFKEGTIKR